MSRLSFVLVLATTLAVSAEPSAELESLRAEVERLQKREAQIEELQAQVAELRAKDQDSWLNERRAEEIKALVHEVLSDAETRASFGEGGITAGWNKHFFLASEDGNFLMEIGGYIQARYIALFRDEPAGGDDEDEAGFQLRRAKVYFGGHVFDPRLEYKVQLAADRASGNFQLEDAYADYEWADHHFIKVGQFKPRYNREELVGATRQQTMERSTVNGFFRLDRPQAIEARGEYDRWNWAVSVHDGREASNVDFHSDSTDVAFAGRAELLVTGKWDQFKHYAAWSGTPFGVLLGAGGDYELAESGSSTNFLFEDFWQWTADASIQLDPVNLFVAGYGRHADGATAIGGDFDQLGLVVQAGVFIIPDKMDLFARWEWLDHGGFVEVKSAPNSSSLGQIPDGLSDEVHLFTFGTNYYFKKHDVKLTFDVVWAPEGLRQDDTSAGLLASGTDDDLAAVRAQFQLLF